MTRVVQSPSTITSDILLAAPDGKLMVPPLPSTRSGIDLSVVVPTYNESSNIAIVIERLVDALNRFRPGSYEIIVVDDDSPDGTWKTAIEVAQAIPNVFVMHRTKERGLATAVVRGWQCARGELLAVIDADLQHPPEVIAQLWGEMERGADLAVGSRHVAGGGTGDWSLMRRVVSRSAQLIGLLILHDVVGRVSDPMSGYFVVRRRRLEKVPLDPLGYKILIEVLARGGVRRISEVGYVFNERRMGASKARLGVYWDYFGHLIRLRVASLSRH